MAPQNEINMAGMELAKYARFAADGLINHLKDSLEELKQTDISDKDLEIRQSMVLTSIKAVSEARDTNQRRLDHALKCIRRKGLYSDEFDGLVDICKEKGLTDARLKLLLIHCCIGELNFASSDGKELSDQTWHMGIELTMLQYEKKRMYSSDLYGPVLEYHIGDIYMNTVLASYVTDLSKALDAHERRIDMLDAVAESYGGFETAFENIYAAISEVANESEGKVKAIKSTLDRQKAAIQAKLDSVQEELSKTNKSMKPLHARNEALEKTVAKQSQDIAAKDARIHELEAILDKKDRQISNLSSLLEQDESLPDLPHDGIVFIGGHINMVKKLEQNYPGWRFIDGGDHNFAEFAPPRLVFFWDKHLSHPTWQRAKRILTADVPVVYLKSTNPEKLENEMRRGYASTVHQEIQE